MIFTPKIFYDAYLKDYHQTKAIYLKKILDELPRFEKEFFGKELNTELRGNFRKTLKADLRQTYFHSIETFFELFFALNPRDKKVLDDEFILFSLTNSNWSNNYKEIEKISKNPTLLDFMDERIEFLGYDISIGHYLFYMGIFSKEKFSTEVFEEINQSIDAIKYGIEILSNDFTKKEEYNAYKHGLRIIPASKKIMIADPKSMKSVKEWDLSDSMSFYLKTKNPDELTVVTRLFDSDRDYLMTCFCSNLIGNLISFRQVAFDRNKNKNSEETIPLPFFGKEEIQSCNKVNVSIQNLVYTIKKNNDT